MMKELKELLCFSVCLLEALVESLEDGAVDFTDVLSLWKPFSKVGEAIDGIEKIPFEIASLDEKDKNELMDYIRSEFDIPDDRLESRIEGGLQLALCLAMYVSMFYKKDEK